MLKKLFLFLLIFTMMESFGTTQSTIYNDFEDVPPFLDETGS